ncbi:MAG: neutral zinc metallopeptidase [Ilumatobacteraceae bacterium]
MPPVPVGTGIVDFGGNKPPRDYDDFVTAVFSDVEAFWAEQLPAVYGEGWTTLDGGVFAAYPDRTDAIPGCGGDETTYDEVRESGAFYCRVDDFIAYDDADLVPGLVDDLGREAVAIVLAHEFGHAVQERIGEFDQPTILKEQQADCFAGAWAASAATDGDRAVHFDDVDLRAGLIAMIQIRDPVELGGLDNPDAHGTGFDRVGAFQDGFNGGVERCATFFSEDRESQLIDIPFVSGYEDPNLGDLPVEDPDGVGSDIVTLIPESLDQFWLALTAASDVGFAAPTFESFEPYGGLPSCPSLDTPVTAGDVIYCPGDRTIYWDRALAERLVADPLGGDLSIGYLLANAYSEAVLRALSSTSTGEERALAGECLTGAWVGSIVPPTPADSAIQLSAGDLDEAIVTAIRNSDPSDDTNIVGSAFEKIAAFRAGVLGGIAAC